MSHWFETQKERARQLKTTELRQHAAVARLEGEQRDGTDNGTRCGSCFCCAAEVVLKDERNGEDVKFYTARRRGAIGIATVLVTARDYDDFQFKHPTLELLGVYDNYADARRHFTDDQMAILARDIREGKRNG